jgi:hypothetical protein
VEDLGGGHYLIDVYDNNREYTPQEDSDVSGAPHMAAQDISRISIAPSGWDYDMGTGAHWGGSWGNLNSGIMVLPYSLVNQKMHIPSFSNLPSLAASLVAFGSTGGTTTPPVTTGTLPVGVVPLTFGSRGGDSILAIHGTTPLRLHAVANGPYRATLLTTGGGATATTTAHTGTTDTVTPLSGGVSMQTGGAKPLVLTSVTKSSTTALSTTMSLTTGAGSTSSLQVTRGVLSARVTTAGVASFTTSSSGVARGGTPLTTSFRVPLAAGDRITVAVATLAAPGASLRLTVTRRGSSRVVTVARRAVVVATVRPLTLTTAVGHGRSTATARIAITAVAAGTQGLLTVRVFSHGRLIATRTLTRATTRRGALAVAVAWTARRGSYVVRVTVDLTRAGSMTGQVARSLSRTITVR